MARHDSSCMVCTAAGRRCCYALLLVQHAIVPGLTRAVLMCLRAYAQMLKTHVLVAIRVSCTCDRQLLCPGID